MSNYITLNNNTLTISKDCGNVELTLKAKFKPRFKTISCTLKFSIGVDKTITLTNYPEAKDLYFGKVFTGKYAFYVLINEFERTEYYGSYGVDTSNYKISRPSDGTIQLILKETEYTNLLIENGNGTYINTKCIDKNLVDKCEISCRNSSTLYFVNTEGKTNITNINNVIPSNDNNNKIFVFNSSSFNAKDCELDYVLTYNKTTNKLCTAKYEQQSLITTDIDDTTRVFNTANPLPILRSKMYRFCGWDVYDAETGELYSNDLLAGGTVLPSGKLFDIKARWEKKINLNNLTPYDPKGSKYYKDTEKGTYVHDTKYLVSSNRYKNNRYVKGTKYGTVTELTTTNETKKSSITNTQAYWLQPIDEKSGNNNEFGTYFFCLETTGNKYIAPYKNNGVAIPINTEIGYGVSALSSFGYRLLWKIKHGKKESDDISWVDITSAIDKIVFLCTDSSKTFYTSSKNGLVVISHDNANCICWKSDYPFYACFYQHMKFAFTVKWNESARTLDYFNNYVYYKENISIPGASTASSGDTINSDSNIPKFAFQANINANRIDNVYTPGGDTDSRLGPLEGSKVINHTSIKENIGKDLLPYYLNLKEA